MTGGKGIDQQALAYVLNKQATELAVLRILLSCLIRQVSDPNTLRLDFDQSIEEHRALGELSGEDDPVFEAIQEHYANLIEIAGEGPLARD